MFFRSSFAALACIVLAAGAGAPALAAGPNETPTAEATSVASVEDAQRPVSTRAMIRCGAAGGVAALVAFWATTSLSVAAATGAGACLIPGGEEALADQIEKWVE